MSLAEARTSIKRKMNAYFGFQGIDDSRDKTTMDSGEKQALVFMENCYCNWQGLIVNDAGFKRRNDAGGVVRHIAFLGKDTIAWVEDANGVITLASDNAEPYQEAFPKRSIVTSTTFNRKLILATKDATPLKFDGSQWLEFTSPNVGDPRYVCAVQRRLAMAGMRGYPTQVWFSRVDEEDVMPDDEAVDAPEVTKAAFIDIANIIGIADSIKGIAVFENTKLAIFTNDRTVIYQIDPDYSKWELDKNSNINIGTISHNTICQAGSDLFFCSRIGIHSLRRSEQNGLTIYTLPVSVKVSNLYRKYMLETENPESISACYNQDLGQYHIFFPRPDGTAKRLTFTLYPTLEQIASVTGTWSTGSAIGATCAATLGGEFIVGAKGGIWRSEQDKEYANERPDAIIETPILWHGSMTDPKQSHTIVIQAMGSGTISVEAFNEVGRELSSFELQVSDTEDGTYPLAPLSRNIERRFEHQYRGVQLRFTIKSKYTVKIIGFAINIRG